MDPLDLGLGPAPSPPQMPAPTTTDPSKAGRLIQLALMGLAGGLGPGAGTGILQGLHTAMQERQQTAQRTDQANRTRYEQEQQNYELQQRAFQQEQQRREQVLQQNLTQLRTLAPTLPTKEDYDKHVDAYASGLQALGFRLDGNFLRTAVPYVAPTAKNKAQKALDAFLKNPLNKSLLDKPEALQGAYLQFDRDGDGLPEAVPVYEVAQIAQMPLGTDPSGKVLAFPKGTTSDVKANADGLLGTLIEKAKAEGKEITPELQIELQKQAIRMAKEAGDLGPDPTLQAIRELTLEQKRNVPTTTLPPAVQRRVDVKSRAFDSLPIVKRTQTMAEAVSFANSLDPNTKNPADDQALIYAFAKAMDPESVVREGEYATVQKYAQSWAQTYGFSAKRLFSNTAFLTPQARANMKKTIMARYGAAKTQYDNVRKSYAGQIDKILGGTGGEEYLTDYGAAFPSETDATGGGTSVTVGGKTFGVQVVP